MSSSRRINACRTCLSTEGEMISLYADTCITKKIMSIIDVTMDEDDGLPDKICRKCVYLLESFHCFKEQLVSADKRLRKVWTNEEEENGEGVSRDEPISGKSEEVLHDELDYDIEWISEDVRKKVEKAFRRKWAREDKKKLQESRIAKKNIEVQVSLPCENAENKTLKGEKIADIVEDDMCQSEEPKDIIENDTDNTKEPDDIIKNDIVKSKEPEDVIKNDIIKSKEPEDVIKNYIIKSKESDDVIKNDIVKSKEPESIIKNDTLESDVPKDIVIDDIANPDEPEDIVDDDTFEPYEPEEIEDNSVKIDELKDIEDNSIKPEKSNRAKDDSLKSEEPEDIKDNSVKSKERKDIQDDSPKFEQLKDIKDNSVKSEERKDIQDDSPKSKQPKDIEDNSVKSKESEVITRDEAIHSQSSDDAAKQELAPTDRLNDAHQSEKSNDGTHNNEVEEKEDPNVIVISDSSDEEESSERPRRALKTIPTDSSGATGNSSYTITIVSPSYPNGRKIITIPRVPPRDKKVASTEKKKDSSRREAASAEKKTTKSSPRRFFQCTRCNVNLFTVAAVLLHHNQVHTPNKASLCCRMCDKTFPAKSNLFEHFNQHIESHLFRCSFCPNEFVMKENLFEHMKIHKKRAGAETKSANKRVRIGSENFSVASREPKLRAKKNRGSSTSPKDSEDSGKENVDTGDSRTLIAQKPHLNAAKKSEEENVVATANKAAPTVEVEDENCMELDEEITGI